MRVKRVSQARRFFWFILPMSLAVLGAAAAITPVAAGQTGSVLYKFQGGFGDGSRPYGALIADHAGNLYGATAIGGDSGPDCYLGAAKKGCGAIFELTPPSVPDASWSEVLLYSFQGITDGDGPGGPLVFDKAGNLFGTTQGGGSNAACPNCGTVFELSPPTSEGGVWKETVIHRFAGLSKPDGASPNGGLVFDKNGNLYGTTFIGGGLPNMGIVFELSPPAVSGGAWKETVIHRFTSFPDGAYPLSSLIIDNGALYGMTSLGGLDCYNDFYGCGTVYKLAPAATAGNAWGEEVLYRFGQFGLHPDDGTNPEGGLIFDTLGNLYGTTANDGSTQCAAGYAQCGTVFQLSPPISGLGLWTETTLWKFAGGSDGTFPQTALVTDSQGALYGTTPAGGSGCVGGDGCGIVFKLVPPAMPGVSWTEQLLHVFGVQRGDGREPLTALLPIDGKFYGTTEQGGAISPTCYGTCGTVFAIAP